MFTLSFANVQLLEKQSLARAFTMALLGFSLNGSFKPGYLPSNNLSREEYFKKFPQK